VLVIGILAVSTSSIFIRFAQLEASSMTIAAYRLTIASLILAPITITRYRADLKHLSRQSWLWALLSGAFLAIHFASWIRSLEFTNVVSSVVLVTTTPIWVALFSPFTIREKVARLVMVGMGLAFVGTLLIGLADACQFSPAFNCPSFTEFVRGPALFGDLLALVGAWAAAGYLLVGRKLRESLPMTPYITLVYGSAAVLLLIYVTLFQVPMWGFRPPTYLWLALIGLVPQLIGHSAFNWALGYLPASLVSVTLLGEPIGTAFLAAIILGEIPGPINLLGAILILVGIGVASLAKPAAQA
jgi:drug/metabolite transporter (DMT)-like permease